MKNKLTAEQIRVVEHPVGQHARVLAVAGSGKSTTMAHRIKYLVENKGVHPQAILVLMFNTLARQQFKDHLASLGLPESHRPTVHTFHSFSFQLINHMVKLGVLLPNTQFWLSDQEELIWLTVKRAIQQLEKQHRIVPETVEPEAALQAISLWKGALIPPERAGSFANPGLPVVYAEFERLRRAEVALTFDDFVPLAVSLLEGSTPELPGSLRDLQHVIVDEYQDINAGQQHLIELLAGEQADVMVVGDDDQTIYEWRGARPNYIIEDFAQVFDNKPLQDYRLSRSFRFGPVIAQCAANVIAHNSRRVEKPLIAFSSQKPGFIQVLAGGQVALKELAEQVEALTQVDQVPPNEIVVLARLFAQLDGLEAEFLARQIPYRVVGQAPFFKRREIQALLDYLRLGLTYQEPLLADSSQWVLNVANKPSRMLSRSLLHQLLTQARFQGLSLQMLLSQAVEGRLHGLQTWQQRALSRLWDFLEGLHFQLQQPEQTAGALLAWMVKELNYLAYFQDYYGKGMHADEKIQVVENFVRYVQQLGVDPQTLLARLENLDTTQGAPEEELITFTTIFRTKGLEYAYILLPACDENLLPYLRDEFHPVHDVTHPMPTYQPSSVIENERRLFYVALTRARAGVLIGTNGHPSRFLEEIDLAATRPVMEAVEWLARGAPQAADQLVQALGQEQLPAAIRRNVLGGYLADLDEHELLERLHDLYPDM